MDPAGPLFFNDLPKPYSGLNCPSGARLNVSDADLVDVIHTDGKIDLFCLRILNFC